MDGLSSNKKKKNSKIIENNPDILYAKHSGIVNYVIPNHANRNRISMKLSYNNGTSEIRVFGTNYKIMASQRKKFKKGDILIQLNSIADVKTQE